MTSPSLEAALPPISVSPIPLSRPVVRTLKNQDSDRRYDFIRTRQAGTFSHPADLLRLSRLAAAATL
jgi:hypothetical protein